jgi:uncharacterized repeat protein (TIGR01451 family)
VILNNSTLSDNHAQTGGGIWAGSNLHINSSTISGNSAMSGGGIYLPYSSSDQMEANTINSSTIVNNTANEGGGLWKEDGDLILKNTILAGNQSADSGAGPDCFSWTGGISSGGYNLIGDPSDCNFASSTGDLISVDPRIDALEGFPAYHPLQVGSPALHAGNPAGCSDYLGNPLPLDQRGLPRVDVCDIGAVEMQKLELSSKTSNEAKGTPGSVFTYTVTLHNLSADNLNGVTVTDTLPNSLAYEQDSLQASSGSYEYDEGVISWSGSVDAESQETITFQARINDNIPPGANITNTATIQGGGDIWVRTATVEVIPFKVFLSCILRNYCPDFFDDFSDPVSGWFVGNDEYHRVDYFNQEYRIRTKQSEYIYLFRAPTCARENYVVEADMRWNGDDYGYGYGLLFGLNGDYSQYYYFEVLALEKYYQLWRRDSTGFSLITGPTYSSAINAGTGVNHLKVTRKGDQITLNVNGTDLGTWTDGVFTGLTYTGVATNPYLDKPVSDLRVDNFSAEYLSGGVTSSTQTNNAVPVWPEKVHFHERAVEIGQ